MEDSNERLVEKIVSILGEMDEKAGNIVNSFYLRIMENPLSAVEELHCFISKARNINPGGMVGEAYAGGPNYDWTGPVIDMLGTIYPLLEKEVRKKGLLETLSFLDGLNYFNSQNNVELINEPWLVADIIINRPLYWPGYKQYCNLLEQNPNWIDFSQHIDSVKSKFWLALTITRPKYSSLDIRANFYTQFPDLIDRTGDAIATIIFNYAQQESQKNGNTIEPYIEENLLDYDPHLHNNIRKKIEEKKWIKLDY